MSVTAPPSEQVVALEAEVDSLRSRLADAERRAAGSADGGVQSEANGAGGAGRSEHDFNELEAELLGWPLPPNRSAQSFSNSSLGVPGRGYHGRIKIEIVFMMVAGRNGGGVSD
jgi:hypothetical protein